jgi:hypothetical protein
MSNLLLEDSPVDVENKPFNSLTPEQLSKLEAAFWSDEEAKKFCKVAEVSGVAAVGVAVLGAGDAFATTGAGGANAASNAKTVIEGGVANAIGMIQAIDGIGLAAFGVALAPMGFMVTLRVLNMVLSRV